MTPRVLLSSVFKPFAVDNMYSRVDSKAELFHNQLTKYQGVFSLRASWYSLGLHTIARNIEAPATVLDFPTLPRFRKELRKGYDIVGIGAIVPNFQKVKRMVEETRELSPRSTIVIGGFCATIPNLDKMLDVDHVCIGDGVTFMRDLLGESPEFEFKHPEVVGEVREIFGVPIIKMRPYPCIVVGLGCSYGCDFCSPSHFFGRRHVRFLKTGREIFELMVALEKKYHTNQMPLMGDDNFLLDLKRAEELRKCVVESGKVFNMLVFASADRVREFGPERLAEMGAGTIWIGREGKYSDYKKNRDADLAGLLAELRRYGIKTILSTILLLDGHTKENIEEEIDEHLACRPTMSQFSHYAPTFGTPLYDRLAEKGRILAAVPLEEWHAFHQPWFVHPEFTLKEAEEIQEHAYLRDFHELGPTLLRYIDADHEAWQHLKDSPKSHLQARARYFAGEMSKYKIMLLAMEHLVPTSALREMVRGVRARVEGSFGPAGMLERSVARGLFFTGRAREVRTRHFGDAIQPRTKVVRYNQG